MTKILQGYAMASSTTLKNRCSSIGSVFDDSGNNQIEVTNVKFSEIEDTLNLSNKSFYNMWVSTSVNRNSEFSPFVHSINNNDKRYQHIFKTGGSRFGDFAGYDHIAESMDHALEDTTSNISNWYGSSNSLLAQNTVYIMIGEMDVDGTYNSAYNKVTTQVYDGNTLLATDSTNDYTDGTDYEHGFPTETNLHNIRGENHFNFSISSNDDGKTFTVKSFLDMNDGNNTPICYLGDDLDWHINVTVKYVDPNHNAEYIDDDNDGSPDHIYNFYFEHDGDTDDKHLFIFDPEHNELDIYIDKVTIVDEMDGETATEISGNVTITLRWYPTSGDPIITNIVDENFYQGEYTYSSTHHVLIQNIDLDDVDTIDLDITT